MSDSEGDFAVNEVVPSFSGMLVPSLTERLERLREAKPLWASTEDLEEEDSDVELSADVERYPAPPEAAEAMERLRKGEFAFTPDDGRGLVQVWERSIPALNAAREWCAFANEVQHLLEYSFNYHASHAIVAEVDTLMAELALDGVTNPVHGVGDSVSELMREAVENSSTLIAIIEEARREQKAAEARARMLERMEAGEYFAIMTRVVTASQAPQYEKDEKEWLEQNGSDTDSSLSLDDSSTDSSLGVSLMHSARRELSLISLSLIVVVLFCVRVAMCRCLTPIRALARYRPRAVHRRWMRGAAARH